MSLPGRNTHECQSPDARQAYSFENQNRNQRKPESWGQSSGARSELRGGQGPSHVEGLGPGDDSREESLKCFKQWMEGMWPYLCSSLWPLADPQ